MLQRFNVGAFVKIKQLPRGFLNNLPEEDKIAIREAVNHPMEVTSDDDALKTEIKFTDKQGVIHFLYIDRIRLRRVR